MLQDKGVIFWEEGMDSVSIFHVDSVFIEQKPHPTKSGTFCRTLEIVHKDQDGKPHRVKVNLFGDQAEDLTLNQTSERGILRKATERSVEMEMEEGGTNG